MRSSVHFYLTAVFVLAGSTTVLADSNSAECLAAKNASTAPYGPCTVGKPRAIAVTLSPPNVWAAPRDSFHNRRHPRASQQISAG
jgi:hypothetical protein